MSPLVFIVMTIIGVLWWWWQRDANREEIRREARRWNARAIRIQWLPGHTMNENETAYEVTLQRASGERIQAVCRCSPFDAIVWEGTPWWAHAQPSTPTPTPTPAPGSSGAQSTDGDSFRDTLAAYGKKQPPAEGRTTGPAADA